MAARFGFGHVVIVTVYLDAHVIAVETYGGILLCGTVIYKLGGDLCFFSGVDGRFKGA